MHPKAFREIGHWFDGMIIQEQLLNHRSSQTDFWRKLVDYAKAYLKDHSLAKDEKSKCLYLKRFFVPNVMKLIFPNETNSQ